MKLTDIAFLGSAIEKRLVLPCRRYWEGCFTFQTIVFLFERNEALAGKIKSKTIL